MTLQDLINEMLFRGATLDTKLLFTYGESGKCVTLEEDDLSDDIVCTLETGEMILDECMETEYGTETSENEVVIHIKDL